MTNPLVSIIVPVYNAQKGLSRCLESICSQTYQELEIIVLNDGSTDDSLAICEQFRAKDPRIVVVDKENEGVSRTRNAGLTLAQGDYIQFADSDDALDPDYTQNLVQAALQHNADLVIAPYWMVIPSNSSKTGHALETLQTSLGIEPEAPKTEVHKYGFLPQGVYSREDYARRLMQQPASFYYGVLWNKLYRREIIAQNQLGFAPDVHGFLCRVDDLEWPPRCSGHHQRKNHLKSSNSGQTAVCPELLFYGKSQDGKRQLTFVLFSVSSRWQRTSRPAMRARPRSGGVPAARTLCGGNRSAMRPAPCPARRARWER